MTRSRVTGDVGYRAYKKNFLINGDMSVSQRGDGPFTTNTFTMDRWNVTSVTSVSRVALDSIGASYAMSIVDDNLSSVGVNIRQYVELKAAGRKGALTGLFTISWYMSSDTAEGNTFCAFNFTDDSVNTNAGTTVETARFPLTATLTRYEATVDLSTITINPSNLCLRVAVRSEDQVSQSTLLLTNVQLEEGSSATPFEYVSPQQNLAECQRYYEVGSDWFFTNSSAGGTTAYISYPFAVTKRTTPDIVGTQLSSITNGGWDSVGSSELSSFAATKSPAANVDYRCFFSWTADAEL